MHVHVCVHAHVHAHVHLHVHLQVHVLVRVHVHVHVRVHVHVHCSCGTTLFRPRKYPLSSQGFFPKRIMEILQSEVRFETPIFEPENLVRGMGPRNGVFLYAKSDLYQGNVLWTTTCTFGVENGGSKGDENEG